MLLLGKKILGQGHVGDHITISQQLYVVTFGFDVRTDFYFLLRWLMYVPFVEKRKRKKEIESLKTGAILSGEV